MIGHRIAKFALSGMAILGATLPLAAVAQADVGKNQKARETLDKLGQCLAVVRSAEVGRYLSNPGDSTWYEVTARRNDEAPCVGLYMITASQSAMRGAVAEAWYLINHADGAPAVFSRAENAAPPQAEAVQRIAAASEEARAQVIVDEFARCVAATMPVQVDALLRTPVASAAESEAVETLSTGFAPCVFEGQKLGFDAETLRAALAFALVRRAMHEA